jgi:hypothetical protein
MTWGRALSAALRALAGAPSPVRGPRESGADMPGPAQNTSPSSKPAGLPDLDARLAARGMRIMNRCPVRAARYLAVHRNLRRGA